MLFNLSISCYLCQSSVYVLMILHSSYWGMDDIEFPFIGVKSFQKYTSANKLYIANDIWSYVKDELCTHKCICVYIILNGER